MAELLGVGDGVTALAVEPELYAPGPLGLALPEVGPTEGAPLVGLELGPQPPPLRVSVTVTVVSEQVAGAVTVVGKGDPGAVTVSVVGAPGAVLTEVIVTVLSGEIGPTGVQLLTVAVTTAVAVMVAVAVIGLVSVAVAVVTTVEPGAVRTLVMVTSTVETW